MGIGTTLPENLENDIVQWINALRSEGIPVSSTMLRCHALDVAQLAGITHGFTATATWLSSFLTRHRLSLRQKTRQGQVTPEEGEKVVKEFAERIRALIVENDIAHVYNADQTAVFYEYLPKTTIDKKGAKTARALN